MTIYAEMVSRKMKRGLGKRPMENCPENREQLIEAYVFGELTGEALDNFEEHIFACNDCARAVRERQVLKDEIAGASPEVIAQLLGSNAESARQIIPWYYLAAAAIALFAMISWALWTPATLEDPFAANYQTHPDLEREVSAIYRTGSQVVVTGPDSTGYAVLPVEFNWQFSDEAALTDGLVIKIANNQAEVMHSSSVELDGYSWSGPADPGLFYWSLETDSSVVYFGKFRLKNLE